MTCQAAISRLCPTATLLAAPRGEPAVLGARIAVLSAHGGRGGLAQRGAQPPITLAGVPGEVLAGRLVVARAHPGPGRQMRWSGKPAHVHAELRDENLG